MIPCVSTAVSLPRNTGRPVAVAADRVRAGGGRRDPHQPRRVGVQGQVRGPSEEQAGAPAGRLRPRHVRRSGYFRAAYPTRRRPAPQRPGPPHRRLRGRDAR